MMSAMDHGRGNQFDMLACSLNHFTAVSQQEIVPFIAPPLPRSNRLGRRECARFGFRRMQKSLGAYSPTKRPAARSAIRVPRKIASRTSCVTNTIDFPGAMQALELSLQFCSRNRIECAKTAHPSAE